MEYIPNTLLTELEYNTIIEPSRGGDETMNYTKFNRELFLNNVKACAKSKGMSMKDVETTTGVSQGYFSKVAKEDGPIPSIEIVAKTAQTFNTLIDTLLFIEFSERTPEDVEVAKILTDICRDTARGMIKWRRYEPDEIRQMNNGPFSALFEMACPMDDEEDMSEIPWVYIMDNQPAYKWKTTRFMGYSYMARLNSSLSMYIVSAEDFKKDMQGFDIILEQGKKVRVLYSTRTNNEPEAEALIQAIYDSAETMAFHKYDGISLEWLREYQETRNKLNNTYPTI